MNDKSDDQTSTNMMETAQANTRLQRGGFRKHVGYKTTVWREGYAEVVLALEGCHGNTIGALHGGVYMTVLDAAMGQAATWCAVQGHVRRCVTVSLSTSFLKAAWGPEIRVVTRLISNANRIAVCRGEIFDADGGLCATGQGTFRYRAGSESVDGVPDDGMGHRA